MRRPIIQHGGGCRVLWTAACPLLLAITMTAVIVCEAFVLPTTTSTRQRRILSTKHETKPWSSLWSSSNTNNSISVGDFCSEIFLETTDAFGIVYNANYLTLYQRALEETLFPNRSSGLLVMERCEEWKYMGTATLGDAIRIESCLLHSEKAANVNGDDDDDDEEILTVWEQTCIRVSDSVPINSVISWVRCFSTWDDKHDKNDSNNNNNMFKLPVTLPSSSQRAAPSSSSTQYNNGSSSFRLPSSTPTPRGSRFVSDPIRVYLDECQPLSHSHSHSHNNNNRHEYNFGIGLLTVLKYLERSRTQYFGGPSDLLRFTDEGYAVVVAKMDHVILHDTNNNIVTNGDYVVVENHVHVRGRSLVTFYHRIYRLAEPPSSSSTLQLPPKTTRDNSIVKKEESEDGRSLIAEATVVLACLSKTSGRATAFPQWAMEKLN